MNSSENILNELASISQEVARIDRQLPYQAPAGYFDTLAEQVLARIKAEEGALPTVLQGVKVNPFTVPAGYFDALPEAILQKVKAEAATTAQEELSVLSPLLSGLNKKMPFHTPDGYFSDLTDNAVSGARAIDFVNEELENLSPVMAGLKDKQVYEVPVGYFEQLPGQMLNKVKTLQQSAKVVSMSFAREVVRFAAAAVIVGALALGGWWLAAPSVQSVTAGGTVAKNTTPAVGLDKVSDSELQDFLEDESAPLPSDLLAMNDKNQISANDMSDMLSEVSDEDIQKYLEQNTLVKLNKTSTN